MSNSVFIAVYLIINSLILTSLARSGSNLEIIKLRSPRYHVSEVPHWDPETQSLYFINIDGVDSNLNRYDYRSNKIYKAKIDGAPNLLFILPIESRRNQYLVGIQNKAMIVDWNGQSPKAFINGTLFEFGSDPSVGINDVKTDSQGRFYGGSKNVESCSTNEVGQSGFYRYQPSEGKKKLFDGVKISNGLTWVPQTNKFYYIDSCAYDVKEFNYDAKTGAISNMRTLFTTTYSNGTKPDYILDGMTNDVDGNLYLATFDGSKIIKLDSRNGKVLMKIPMEATQITSLAFGGPNLDELFVTTANKDGKQPAASGYVYRIIGLGVKGYPGYRVKI